MFSTRCYCLADNREWTLAFSLSEHPCLLPPRLLFPPPRRRGVTFSRVIMCAGVGGKGGREAQIRGVGNGGIYFILYSKLNDL